MKEVDEGGQILMTCACHDVSHQMITKWFYDCGEYDIYTTIHLCNFGFWKRLKHAWRYLLGKKSVMGDFEEFMFSEENIPALEEIVRMLKENKRNEL